ncbi:EAL domain-containing protein [Hamadaea tsunoensis]|uniref:EAL domain-containing protein n=1 Tax=Hamadaea tsunoensis TaxID=53368 RepID=UPI00146F964F|nr:EAL domain-containing protein [Hamadaea tsunoensis]
MTRRFTLGVLSPFLGGWYFGGILAGIARAGRSLDAGVIAIQTSDAGTEQTEIDQPPEVRHPIAWDHVSGFVVILNAAGPQYLLAAQQAGKPVVTVPHDVPDLSCPAVRPDNRTGAREAVTHLIAHGHTRIAFAGYLGASDVRERLDAYRHTMRAHGLEPDPALLFEAADNHEGGGELAARHMIETGVRSTAVLAGTDANAAGIMRVLTAGGLRLPDDQAVVGFDDQRMAAYLDPPLTTVRQPVEMLGYTAATELVRLIRGERPSPAPLHVPTGLVVRASCGCDHGHRAGTRPADAAGHLKAALAPLIDEVGLAAVAPHVEVLAAAIGGGPDRPTAARIHAALQGLTQATGRPEILMDLVNTVSDCGTASASERSSATPSAEPSGIPIESMMRDMMHTLGRAQFRDSVYLQRTLSRQYEVSTQLLRAHREDPRRLAWLARTQARAGSLGLWTPDGQVMLAGAYRRNGEPADQPAPTTAAAFPPAGLLAEASEHPQEVVFVVPVKVDTSDWGLLAVVDRAEQEVETGREPINQWAALLAHTLDYDQLVQDLRKGKDQLRTAALYDDLTGLPNRAFFLDRLREALDRDRPADGGRIAVLFLDLDGFKVINDSLGHTAGDGLLVQVATRITENLREADTAARFGGDEFLILLDGVDRVQQATDVARRLQDSFFQPFHVQGHDVVVTASIGVALADHRRDAAEDLVRDADVAMYTAKSAMKGSHAIFDSSMRAKAVKRLQIETELRWAIEHGEIETYVQPIVHMATGEVTAFEALARWRHPARGLISPNDFLPVAEETGMITEIGRQILTESGRRLASWRAATGRDLRISVNVSHSQLWTRTLVGLLADCLRESRLDGRCLALELTESVVMRDVTQARTILTEIHELGCEVYIDDFGTGYSSLEALHRLPIDALKIDRSFVSRLGSDTKSDDLVGSMVLMGRKLGLQIIAEGVETADQRDRLLGLDCGYGQGFLYAMPFPADQALEFLRRWQG